MDDGDRTRDFCVGDEKFHEKWPLLDDHISSEKGGALGNVCVIETQEFRNRVQLSHNIDIIVIKLLFYCTLILLSSCYKLMGLLEP